MAAPNPNIAPPVVPAAQIPAPLKPSAATSAIPAPVIAPAPIAPAPTPLTPPVQQDMEQVPETAQSRATLAQAVRTLQAKGDNATIQKLVTAYKAKYIPASQAPAKNLGDMAAAEYMGAGKKIVDSVQEAASKFNPDDLSAGGVVKNVGAAGEGLLGAGAGIVKGLFAPVTAVIQKALALNPFKAAPGDKSITAPTESSPVGQAIQSWAQVHPEAARNLVDAFTVGSTVAGGEGGLLGETVAKTPVSDIIPVAKGLASDAAGGVKVAAETLAHPIDTVTGAVSNAADKLQSYYAAKNVNPQLESSVGRLQEAAPLIGGGAARQKTLVELYDSFANQETKHLADIKQDPAISTVGENIGDAFGGKNFKGPNGQLSIVEQRRAAGSTMASELEKTAKVPVDTQGAFGDFQKELIDNGAAYDSVGKELSAGPESKFSTADKGILEKYAYDLQKLGPQPTMKAVDAFISRIPQDIKALKATRGITFKTNAERLISNNLNSLRKSLSEVATPEYNTARATYSDLSKVIDEGTSHLGKLTQSGDYAKDASLAKGSVQSVLNNGKKDWLMRLEALTGYPALDEATLALQAMKDAGDFKGNSLLDLLTQQAGHSELPIINGFGSMAFNAAKTGVKYAKGKALGTPAEQTRAYLQSIIDAAKQSRKGK